ncbi:MAG: TetR/AcrR family transcriptional regulator, partial [Bacteroidota bacterium]
ERSRMIAERERLCRTIDPELVELLAEVKEDLLFNRQLRVHRENPDFRACFEQSNAEVQDAFLPLLASDLGLTAKPNLARLVLGLALENFYLQITEETLNQKWLSAYFHKIRFMVDEFQRG